jgi:hypothetical protein
MDAAEEHRRHITRWFYECSSEMHVGLGEMYAADPRFKASYEAISPGLAKYLRDAVKPTPSVRRRYSSPQESRRRGRAVAASATVPA